MLLPASNTSKHATNRPWVDSLLAFNALSACDTPRWLNQTYLILWLAARKCALRPCAWDKQRAARTSEEPASKRVNPIWARPTFTYTPSHLPRAILPSLSGRKITRGFPHGLVLLEDVLQSHLPRHLPKNLRGPGAVVQAWVAGKTATALDSSRLFV